MTSAGDYRLVLVTSARLFKHTCWAVMGHKLGLHLGSSMVRVCLVPQASIH